MPGTVLMTSRLCEESGAVSGDSNPFASLGNKVYNTSYYHGELQSGKGWRVGQESPGAS